MMTSNIGVMQYGLWVGRKERRREGVVVLHYTKYIEKVGRKSTRFYRARVRRKMPGPSGIGGTHRQLNGEEQPVQMRAGSSRGVEWIVATDPGIYWRHISPRLRELPLHKAKGRCTAGVEVVR